MKKFIFVVAIVFLFNSISTSQVVGDVRQINGYVEMYTGSEWHPICDDLIEENATTMQNFGNVVCRQLTGNPNAFVSWASDWDGDNVFGINTLGGCNNQAPSNDFSLDNVVCDGSEPNVLACMHNEIGDHNCGSTETFCVECNVNGVIGNYYPYIEPRPIPTLSQWTIIALGMIMLILGLVARKDFISLRFQGK